ncbi:MAG: LysR family transcriptional regulator [Lachnospiraceae bacterium]|jgi:DNA-binding transcriptional LysR family regulator|nr:LysR family transcriptional regulator [Lachnospiraceae bacterium]MBR4606734.1 LysR family transcriptional regulator [Lachnospiraceae bacterium]MBR6152549.1 LysR family transcriptional regulator [Lachnospiraceae bacterium]
MNSRQLQYVITLAETKSFSEAAEKLMVSQPSLSQLISKLEDEIGVQLFERTVPLTITYAGEVYVNTAKKILSEEAEMQDTMAYLRGDNAGKLKIATGYLNAVAVLPELIAGFQRSHPNVQIEIFEDIEPNLKPLVDSGKVDLVLATSQFDSAGYEKVLIGEEQYLFAIPKSFGTFGGSDIDKDTDYPNDRTVRPLNVAMLENIPIIRLQQNTYIRGLVDSLYEIHHIKPRSTIECTTAIGAYSMAKAGLGATMVSYSMYKYDYSYKLNYYSMSEVKLRRLVSIVYDKRKYLSNLAQEFIDVGKQYYK